MGMGIEMPSPRQPCKIVSHQPSCRHDFVRYSPIFYTLLQHELYRPTIVQAGTATPPGLHPVQVGGLYGTIRSPETSRAFQVWLSISRLSRQEAAHKIYAILYAILVTPLREESRVTSSYCRWCRDTVTVNRAWSTRAGREKDAHERHGFQPRSLCPAAWNCRMLLSARLWHH